jgi:hypothetical protein
MRAGGSGHRRGDRHPLDRAGDYGHPVRPEVPCARARRQIGHLFPHLPERTAYHKRRLRLSGQTEALIGEFARRSAGYMDDLLLVDSTPVECARSRETVKRGGSSSLADALANAADYGCALVDYTA